MCSMGITAKPWDGCQLYIENIVELNLNDLSNL